MREPDANIPGNPYSPRARNAHYDDEDDDDERRKRRRELRTSAHAEPAARKLNVQLVFI